MGFEADRLARVVSEIRACTLCAPELPLGPNPIVAADARARILLVSQAPGRIAHEKSIAYLDPSGRRLREWLGVTEAEFYESGRFVVMPMGFCFPGKGKGGDLGPRPECAPTWHKTLWDALPPIGLRLLIGAHAQTHYLGNRRARTLTQTVRQYQEYLPEYLPLPHPSPRNNVWMAKNPWFAEEVVPTLQRLVRTFLQEE